MESMTTVSRLIARDAVTRHRQTKIYGSVNSPSDEVKSIINCVECGVNTAIAGEKNDFCNFCIEKHRSRERAAAKKTNRKSVMQALTARPRRATDSQQPAARRELEAKRTERKIRYAGRLLLFILLTAALAAAVFFLRDRETAKKHLEAKPAAARKGGDPK